MLDRARWTNGCAPIFLIGAPRSGTTWLQALLACHPGIYTGPETHFFRSYEPVRAAFLSPRDRPLGPAEYWTPEQFACAIEAQFWNLVSQLPPPTEQPTYFLEKTPDHNCHVAFILDVFPEARFLHLIRDGREVTASYLRVSKSWGPWAPQTASAGANLWYGAVQRAQETPDKIEARGGDRERQYREVRYEALKRDASSETAAVFEWLGLDPADTRPLDGFDSIPTLGKNKNVKSQDHYPQGFVQASDERRPRTSSETGLTHTQRRIVDLVAGPLLRELGYETGRAAPLLPSNGPSRQTRLRWLRRAEKAVLRARRLLRR